MPFSSVRGCLAGKDRKRRTAVGCGPAHPASPGPRGSSRCSPAVLLPSAPSGCASQPRPVLDPRASRAKSPGIPASARTSARRWFRSWSRSGRGLPCRCPVTHDRTGSRSHPRTRRRQWETAPRRRKSSPSCVDRSDSGRPGFDWDCSECDSEPCRTGSRFRGGIARRWQSRAWLQEPLYAGSRAAGLVKRAICNSLQHGARPASCPGGEATVKCAPARRAVPGIPAVARQNGGLCP